MNIRFNYALRTLPLLFYGLLIYFSSFNNSFDYWTPMITLANLPDFLLAGIFNVLLILFLLYIRLMVVRYSFQDLNEKIPHSDLWEKIQFYVTILAIFLVVLNGLLLTILVYNATVFQTLQIGLVLVPFSIDFLFHLKWILLL